MRRFHQPRAALAALALGLAGTGCVSEAQMRLAVQDRDREISMLRAEKVELQERIDLLSLEKQDLNDRLSRSATAPPATVPASAPQQTGYINFPELDEAGITYGSRGDNVVFSMPAEITFASGKATLTASGQDALRKVAKRLLSEFPKDAKFYVEGHTDTDPIKKSTFESNRALSVARAMTVLGFLVTEGRIPDDRFVVVGHGQYMPVAKGDSKDAKAKNRRVEVVVHKRGD